MTLPENGMQENKAAVSCGLCHPKGLKGRLVDGQEFRAHAHLALPGSLRYNARRHPHSDLTFHPGL